MLWIKGILARSDSSKLIPPTDQPYFQRTPRSSDFQSKSPTVHFIEPCLTDYSDLIVAAPDASIHSLSPFPTVPVYVTAVTAGSGWGSVNRCRDAERVGVAEQDPGGFGWGWGGKLPREKGRVEHA